MSSTSSIDELLSGVARLLDQRPELRARVAFVDFTHGDGESTQTLLPTSNGTRSMQGIVEPKFNFEGHAVIAYIAERYLTSAEPETFQSLQLVKSNDPGARGDIGQLAGWPDKIKHNSKGFEADRQRLGGDRAFWHYANLTYNPAQPDAVPDTASASGDLLKQLPGQLALLTNADAYTAADALCFVLHLVGDLHQPLHCAALADGQYFSTPPEYDKGGNSIHFGSQNLHAVWDDAIATQNVDAHVTDAMNKYPFSSFSQAQLGLDLNDIALESFDLAKHAYDDFLAETTYLGEGAKGAQNFSPPPPAYHAHARDVCLQRAALGGYRLALLLKAHLAGGVGTTGSRTTSILTTPTRKKAPVKSARRKAAKKKTGKTTVKKTAKRAPAKTAQKKSAKRKSARKKSAKR
jgi:hypothetical protein